MSNTMVSEGAGTGLIAGDPAPAAPPEPHPAVPGRRRGDRIERPAPPASASPPSPAPRQPVDYRSEFESLVRRQLELLGEDPSRDGLRQTPARVTAALGWLTRGHTASPEAAIGDALFEDAYEGMVMVRDIEMYSLCEHHLLPFFGKVHIAYIPDGRIVGLSKLPRLVESFARRLQVQERLTEQLAQALEDLLRPRGVGVVIEAAHLCMMMRGVEKQASRTVTRALRGEFRTCPMTRDEFLRLARPSA